MVLWLQSRVEPTCDRYGWRSIKRGLTTHCWPRKWLTLLTTATDLRALTVVYAQSGSSGWKQQNRCPLPTLSWIGSLPAQYSRLLRHRLFQNPQSLGPITRRDVGLPMVTGGGGYPTCKQWWSSSGTGLSERLQKQVDPDVRLDSWDGPVARRH